MRRKNMLSKSKVDSSQQVHHGKHTNKEPTITLKKFTSENIDDFMTWATDPEVTKFMMWNTYSSGSEAM